MKIKCLLTTLLFVGMFAFNSLAQVTTASITGKITDKDEITAAWFYGKNNSNS